MSICWQIISVMGLSITAAYSTLSGESMSPEAGRDFAVSTQVPYDTTKQSIWVPMEPLSSINLSSIEVHTSTGEVLSETDKQLLQSMIIEQTLPKTIEVLQDNPRTIATAQVRAYLTTLCDALEEKTRYFREKSEKNTVDQSEIDALKAMEQQVTLITVLFKLYVQQQTIQTEQLMDLLKKGFTNNFELCDDIHKTVSGIDIKTTAMSNKICAPKDQTIFEQVIGVFKKIIPGGTAITVGVGTGYETYATMKWCLSFITPTMATAIGLPPVLPLYGGIVIGFYAACGTFFLFKIPKLL